MMGETQDEKTRLLPTTAAATASKGKGKPNSREEEDDAEFEQKTFFGSGAKNQI
jgi:hypothetical protein